MLLLYFTNLQMHLRETRDWGGTGDFPIVAQKKINHTRQHRRRYEYDPKKSELFEKSVQDDRRWKTESHRLGDGRTSSERDFDKIWCGEHVNSDPSSRHGSTFHKHNLIIWREQPNWNNQEQERDCSSAKLCSFTHGGIFKSTMEDF